ncbi:viral late transcription elongation factor [Equine molluscum contagiosum-like virus]|nr:viral late transcription elongation factor [Equine molluscum contagiosum-like virus]
MSFRDLILYHLVRYLIAENEASLVQFTSLCRCFSVDVPALLARFSTPRHARLLARALNCKQHTEELELSFPRDALRELLLLKLHRFAYTVRRTPRLGAELQGTAVVAGQEVQVGEANDAMLEYLAAEYSPAFYRHTRVSTPAPRPRARMLVCGQDSVPFFAYVSARVVCNRDLRVVVTDACVAALLRAEHAPLLEAVFRRGADNALNRALRGVFYFLRGGHTPYCAESTAASSCA